MRRSALIAATALALGTAGATSAQEPSDRMGDGVERLGEGGRMVLEGLLEELAPLLDDLEGFGAEVLPFMEALRKELGETFENLDAYHPPEVLPNGDIIIRKKEKAPRPKEDEAPIEAPIEL